MGARGWQPGSIQDLAGTRGCLCACVYVRASASAGGWGGGSPLVVHRGQDAEVAVGDRDAMCGASFVVLLVVVAS